MSVSVNLSVAQLLDPDLVPHVAEAAANCGLSPDHLHLEVTESVLSTDPEVTAGVLDQLHSLAVKLAIDDFGTGNSSLTALSRFPFQILKVDQSFVSGIGVRPGDETIVVATIGPAHGLGLTVIASVGGAVAVHEIVRGADPVLPLLVIVVVLAQSLSMAWFPRPRPQFVGLRVFPWVAVTGPLSSALGMTAVWVVVLGGQTMGQAGNHWLATTSCHVGWCSRRDSPSALARFRPPSPLSVARPHTGSLSDPNRECPRTGTGRWRGPPRWPQDPTDTRDTQADTA